MKGVIFSGAIQVSLKLGGRGSVLRKGGEYSGICFSNGMRVPWESEDWIWQEGSRGRKGKSGRRQNRVEMRMKVEYGRDRVWWALPTPVTMISF